MVRNSFILLVVAGFAIFLFSMLQQHIPVSKPNKTAAYYIENEVSELGAANIVTAIVVTYRGLDTLGEVTVLFLAAAIIGFILGQAAPSELSINKVKPSEILVTSSRIIIPGTIILGVYVFINGHLSPGGGFQGGAIIGTAIALMVLSDPEKPLAHSMMHAVESASGIFYLALGLMGLIFANGFLDTRILGNGTLGHLVSAGAIPLIYSLIGLKVGAEISNIVYFVHKKY